MNTYVIIGAPGQGKTPFVRRFIENKRCWIFDIMNEYGSRTKYPGQVPLNISLNPKEQRARYFGPDMDIDYFLRQCLIKTNTICVCEEATAFFEGRASKTTRRVIINRYHSGNVYMFLFHSIAAVPPRIMQMCNYVVLFKTNDEESTVRAKYRSLLEHYLYLQSEPNGSHLIIKTI